MPLYEYRCEPCNEVFEVLVRSASDVPECPRCRGRELARELSVPAAAQVGGKGSPLSVCGPAPASGGGCGAPWCGTGACGMN
jgi:putative FmdB family regulatory protein